MTGRRGTARDPGNADRGAARPARGRMVGLLLVSAVLCGSLGVGALAQDNHIPALAAGVTSQVTALSSIELWLAFAIILFGFIVLCMQFFLLKRATHTEPDDILRLFTVTIIIIGTLALIAIGYSSQQIAPALGLFGTILGYLLGKADERSRNRRPPLRPDPAAEPRLPGHEE
jgi:hypothetical protein